MIHENLEFRTGGRQPGQWLWPKSDISCWKHLNKKTFFDFPKKVAGLTTRKNMIVQAGGNCGIFPKQYASLFDVVITFEPDPVHFTCLSYNVPEKNVFKFQACLGNNTDPKGIDFNYELGIENWGAKKTINSGIIPQITLDSLNLNPDVIHLDIEGYEGIALEGMIQTIKRCRPLIVLETNDWCNSYGWSQEKIDRILFDLGYKIIETWGEKRNDTAYEYQD